jgi:glycerol uptake facilitator-like aquaporin
MSVPTKLVAEFLGTALLVAAVVGSGIMGSLLSTDIGVVLLINTVSTVLALGVLIFLFLPISGAQFNPAVTLIMGLRKELSATVAVLYIVVQVLGGLAGVALGNVMFGQIAMEFSENPRDSLELLIGEVVATAGLIFLILLTVARDKAPALSILVPAWIGAAYFFTSSTSFANPAVTFARMFTNTFTGIAPQSVLPFIGAQIVGAFIGWGIATIFTRTTQKETQNV